MLSAGYYGQLNKCWYKFLNGNKAKKWTHIQVAFANDEDYVQNVGTKSRKICILERYTKDACAMCIILEYKMENLQ